MVRSKVPATPRIESWRSADDPSRLKPRPSTPCCWSRARTSRVSAGDGRRGDGDTDAQAARFVDQFVEIGAGQRIASGEDQLGQRIAEFGDLAQERDAFLEVKFLRMRRGYGLGAAMPAGQRTGLRHFPIDVERGLRVVAQFVMRRAIWLGPMCRHMPMPSKNGAVLLWRPLCLEKLSKAAKTAPFYGRSRGWITPITYVHFSGCHCRDRRHWTGSLVC